MTDQEGPTDPNNPPPCPRCNQLHAPGPCPTNPGLTTPPDDEAA